MAQNRGKQFEQKIKEAFMKVPGVSIDRLHDQTTGFKGSQNICDFIVYKEPYEYYIECKSVHGNTFPFSNVTETQWNGLLEKSKIPGVHAGVLVWWIDHDVTKFIPIEILEYKRKGLFKSIRYDEFLRIGIPNETWDIVTYHTEKVIPGTKKRIFFDYDMNGFLGKEEQDG